LTEHWNALYLKPRTEKKVSLLLKLKGIESFLPLCHVRKKYSDRIKNVEEPLLKSYIFVRNTGPKNPEVLRTDGVLNYVLNSCTGKLALIKQTELDEIKDYLSQKIFEESELDTIKLGDTKTMHAAPFNGRQGQVIEVKKNKIKFIIEELGFVWEVSR
jgi:transcription antitermination factor NusG